MDGAAGAVLGEAARVGGREALGLADRLAVARGARVREERAVGRLRRRGKRRWKSCSRIAVPPSRTGNVFRQSRSASPRPRWAAATGFGRERGRNSVVGGMPITIASSGSSTRRP